MMNGKLPSLVPLYLIDKKGGDREDRVWRRITMPNRCYFEVFLALAFR